MRLQLLTSLLLVACFVVVWILNAWMADDAYITLRTVDNVIHGHGLRWNVAERVQTYTHPLWLLVVTAAYFITREPYYTVLALSALLSVSTFVVVIFFTARSYPAVLLSATALLLSKAFIDYSSSGLENPLSYILAASVAWYFLRHRQVNIWFITFLISLSVLNRQDTLLFFIPILIWLFLNERSWKTVGNMFVGVLPLIVWELFSLFYYGFLTPNTAVAKLNVDLARSELMQQGLNYLWDSLHRDPVTLFIILAATILVIANRTIKAQLLQIGVILYLFYIIWIGGDFMSGRFLSVPFVISVSVIAHSWLLKKEESITWILVVIVLFLGLSVSQSPVYSNMLYHTSIKEIHRAYGIADERGYYYPTTGLLMIRSLGEPFHPWVEEGKKARQKNILVIRRSIGFFGYYAGSRVHALDVYALGDPLLSRLPHLSRRYTDEATLTFWRTGHFRRGVPQGYVETLQTGQNMIKNKEVARYYDLLASVTRDPLFSLKRLKAIWQINVTQRNAMENYQDDEKIYYKDNQTFAVKK